MNQFFKGVAVSGLGFAIVFASINFGQTQTSTKPSSQSSTWNKPHRIVIQVTQNDPAVMNMALNNAENLAKFYKEKGEPAQIEFVAYGAGLNMVRRDTSPVKERLLAMTGTMKNVSFAGCGNTMATQAKQENKDITLVPEAHVVSSGIARVVELEEQGWTYVRP